jgi:hypothetical protein
VNQKEIAEALGIDQRRVSEALTRAVAFDMIGDEEWKKCREAAKGLRKGTGVLFDEEGTPRLLKTPMEWRGAVRLLFHRVGNFTGIPFSLVGPVNR